MPGICRSESLQAAGACRTGKDSGNGVPPAPVESQVASQSIRDALQGCGAEFPLARTAHCGRGTASSPPRIETLVDGEPLAGIDVDGRSAPVSRRRRNRQNCHQLRRVVWRRDHERSGTVRLRRMSEENRASLIRDRCVVVFQTGVPQTAGLRNQSANAEPSYGPLDDVLGNRRRLEMGSRAQLVDRPRRGTWTASLVTAYSRVLREAATTRVVAGTLTVTARAQPSTPKNSVTHPAGMTSATARSAHNTMSDRRHGAANVSAIRDSPPCSSPVIKAPSNRSVKRCRRKIRSSCV